MSEHPSDLAVASADQLQDKHPKFAPTIWILRPFVLPFTPRVKGKGDHGANPCW